MEVEAGLVRRVVVAREPGRRPVGLTDDVGTAARRLQPARGEAGRQDRLGHAAVGDLDLELVAFGDGLGGGDADVAFLGLDLGLLAVDGHLVDVERQQVDGEGAQVLGRGGGHRRHPVDGPVLGVVGEGDVVVGGVVAGGAALRAVLVADAVLARLGLLHIGLVGLVVVRGRFGGTGRRLVARVVGVVAPGQHVAADADRHEEDHEGHQHEGPTGPATTVTAPLRRAGVAGITGVVGRRRAGRRGRRRTIGHRG